MVFAEITAKMMMTQSLAQTMATRAARPAAARPARLQVRGPMNS